MRVDDFYMDVFIQLVNTLRQNRQYFADKIFKRIFFNDFFFNFK